MKERFALGMKPRRQAAPAPTSSASDDLPDPMKREVYVRDQGRCAFVDENGNRCPETGGLEFDHIDGLAQTHVHDVDRSRLLSGRPRHRRRETHAPAAATSNRTCGFPAY